MAGLALGARAGLARIARAPEPDGPLSDAAKALIEGAWKGLDPKRVLDAHVHLVGVGAGGTGCEVGPRLQSWAHPFERLKFSLYLRASGVDDLESADQQYLSRLDALLEAAPKHGRCLLFAFDHAHDDAGQVLRASSEFFTPNDYVLSVAAERPDRFVACASIHPYRADAVDELERVVARGAHAIKWLPNAMNIDPSSARCDAFYDALARLQVPLISHAGEEKAVHAEDAQRLGNPLHLRRALERGVTVVVAHCASLGMNPDLDAGPGAPWVDNFALWLRLMDDPRWAGRLFGDVSAVIQANRAATALKTLLERRELQARLINGSDYPLPGINALVRTSRLVELGFLSEAERSVLNEIDRHDPLLFDFVTKRTLRWAGQRFEDSVFLVNPSVFPRL